MIKSPPSLSGTSFQLRSALKSSIKNDDSSNTPTKSEDNNETQLVSHLLYNGNSFDKSISLDTGTLDNIGLHSTESSGPEACVANIENSTGGMGIPHDSFDAIKGMLQRATRVEQELRCHVAQLESELDRKTSDIQNIQHANGLLSRDAAEVQGQMESLIIGRVEAESRNDALQKSHHLHIDHINEKIRDVLQAQRRIFGTELGRLQCALNDQKDRAGQRMHDFKNQITTLKIKLQEVLDRFKSSERMLKDIQDRADAHLKETIASLEDRFASEKGTMDELIRELSEQLILVGKEKDKIKDDWILDAQQLERNFSEKSSILNAQITTLEVQRQNLKTALNDREKEWDTERAFSADRLKSAVQGQHDILSKFHILQEDYSRNIQLLTESETSRQVLEDKVLETERRSRAAEAKIESLEVALKAEKEEVERQKKFGIDERKNIMDNMKDAADSRLKREKDLLNKDLKQMEEDKKKAETDLVAAAIELSSAKATLAVLTEDRAGLKKTCTMWQESLEVETEARRTAESQLQRKGREIDLIEKKCADRIRYTEDTCNSKVENLSEAVKTLEASVSILSNERIKNGETIDSLRARNAAIEGENFRLRDEINNFKENLNEVQVKYEREQRSLQIEVEEMKTEQSKIIEDARIQVSAADSALLLEKSSAASHRERAEKAQTDLVEVVAELRAKLGAEAHSDRRNRQHAEDILVKHTVAYENHLESLEKANRTLIEQIESLQREIRGLKDKVTASVNEAQACVHRERACEQDMDKQTNFFNREKQDLLRQIASAEARASHADIQRCQVEQLLHELRTSHSDIVYSADLKARQASAETDAVIRLSEQIHNEWISSELAKTSKMLWEINSAAMRVKEQGVHLSALPSIMNVLSSHCSVLERHASDVHRELTNLAHTAAARGSSQEAINGGNVGLSVSFGASPGRPLSHMSNAFSPRPYLTGMPLLSPSRVEMKTSSQIRTENDTVFSPSLHSSSVDLLRAKSKILDATSTAGIAGVPFSKSSGLAKPNDSLNSPSRAAGSVTLPMAGRQPIVLTSPSLYMQQRYHQSNSNSCASPSNLTSIDINIANFQSPNLRPSAVSHPSSCTSPSAAFALSALAKYRSGGSIVGGSPSWASPLVNVKK